MSIVKYIALDMLPLSHTEGQGFIQFVKALSPDYVIPSKTVIKSRIEALYQSVRNDILTTLRPFPDVSITTDTWTSRSAISFITITVHAIDELWNLYSVTLDTLEMTESHSSANIYHHLCNALSAWNLAEKTIAVVHDNARNMVAAMRGSSTADINIGQSVRCFCHSLQLVVEKAFNEEHFQAYLQKVSAIVGHFKHSYKATNALKDAQKLHNLPDHSLISYCVTRWNSAYTMIERLLEQKQAVESVLLNPEFTTTAMCKKLLLSNLEWNYLRDLIRILKPFEVATKIMSSQSESTSGMVRPLIHSIIDKFLTLDDSDDPPKIQSLKEVFRDELEARFLEENCDSVSALACFLDPRYSYTIYFYVNNEIILKNRIIKFIYVLIYCRYKNMADETQEFRESVQSKILEIMAKENFEETPGAVTKNKDLDYLFNCEAFSQSFERMASFESENPNYLDDVNEREIDSFKMEPNIPLGDNPLHWWHSKRHKYPKLASLARRYLGVPASSTPSERAFSTAGNIISSKRNCLLPENANLLIFLYQNRCITEKKINN